MKMPFLSSQKIIFSIGDDGAVLTMIDKGKLITKLFAASAAVSDRREVNTLLQKHPNVPISVLLDSIEQTYSKQILPAVSSLSIGKLVKKRLERDFAKTDITGAIPMGRDTKGRKDWIYMFVSTPATPAIIEWLEYFATLPNKFEGIHLLPIEMENVSKRLNKALFKGEADTKGWQFIVTHNKTGGFRQTILNEEKVVFTRLIRPGRDSLPDIISGNIEQEIINTIDYLRRLGLSDEEPMNVFVLVSQDLKNSLASTKIRGKPLLLFTPFEITKMLGFDSVASKDAKFTDILLATIFASSGPVLRLANPRTKAVDTLAVAYKISLIAAIVMIPILLFHSFYQVYQIISLRSQIKSSEDQKAQIEAKWKTVKNTDQYNLDDANKISDAMFLRRKILDERKTPTDLLEKLVDMNIDFIRLESYSWNFEKDYLLAGSKGKVSAILNLNFSTKGGSLDAMFKNYDILKNSLDKHYPDMAIDISKLPDKITLDNKVEDIPIQVKILTKDQTTAPGMPAPPPPGQAGGRT